MTTLPAVTYQPVTLADAKLQAVNGADRPICALVAAYASFVAGHRLLGAARNLDNDAVQRMFRATFLEKLLPWHRVQAWVEAARGKPIGDDLADGDDVPTTDLGTLTPSLYQIGAVGKLTCAGGLLGMGVGLGKTLTTVLAARRYVRDKLATDARCWIVAPVNALGEWKRFIPYLQTLFRDVALVSVDQAHKLVNLERAAGGVLIVDEVHYAAHDTARRTKSMFQVREAFDVCIGLTGTLLHAGIEPAMTMLDLTLPGACPFATRWQAGEYFRCLVQKEIGSRKVTDLAKPVHEHREKFLAWMAKFSVVLTKHSEAVRAELIIPEQQLITEDLGVSDETIDDCIVRIAIELAAKDPKGELPHASAVGHAALAEGSDGKIQWVMDQLDGTPVVLFAEYHETLGRMRAALDDAKIPYAYVDGSVTGEKRTECVRQFQAGEVNVFLGQIDASGAAVNLHRANVSVAIDHTQKAVNYAQALGRTCRRGQDRECAHIDLVANPLQRICLQRLRAAEDFHLDLARVRAALDRAAVTK